MRKLKLGRAFAGGIGASLWLVASTVGAATITVTNTNDSGAGSLRQAFISANATTASDTIVFDIPGQGPFTISPLTALPPLIQPTIIDGYSQAGASVNTQADGTNARIMIQVDGALAGAGVAGIRACASNSTVRGLSITQFSSIEVLVGAANDGCPLQPTNIQVTGNFIGLAANGVTPLGIRSIGVQVSNAQATIGGNTVAARNIISANINGVLTVSAVAGTSVLNNLIGTDASGTLDRGNSSFGIELSNSNDAITVGTATAPNLVAFNRIGIFSPSSSTGTTLFANHVRQNDELGVDLSAGGNGDGVTLNDVNDVDVGGNDLQNFPAISTITRTATGLHINATLDRPNTAGSRTYTIGVYANSVCDANGHGEGERFLGSFDFFSSGPVIETINVDFTPTAAVPVGSQITLTATDQATGNTSEFSDCALPDNTTPFVVTTLADTAGSTCGATCSLRQAITAANASAGGDVIRFNIVGTGVQQIFPTTPLPNITEALVIDGYTQPGASANTSATADNAVIRIQIDGTVAGFNNAVAGLSACASNVTIRGLSLTAFGRHGIGLGLRENINACTGTPRFFGGVIEGNFVGLSPAGVADGNHFGGIVVTTTDAVVGGVTAAARNVVSDNGANGVQVADGRVEIDNNFIGVGVDGSSDHGNLASGVFADSTGPTPVIVGARARNTIGFNRDGVRVIDTASKVSVGPNDFFGNANLGIDLVASGINPDGVTANDADDADTGGNGLQNFPVLASATQLGATLRVAMNLDVPVGSPTQPQQIALYTSSVCDGSGQGEGELYLGTVSRTVTNATENFTIDLDASAPIGSKITATTSFVDNTSEFSNCVTVVDGDAVFKNSFE